MSKIIEQFERAVMASPGTPRASWTRRAGILYGVTYAVILVDGETSGDKIDLANMEVIPWREDVEEYKVPPGVDVRPELFLGKDAIPLGGLLDEVDRAEDMGFAMGKWGSKANMALHVLRKTGESSFDELASVDSDSEEFASTVADVWRFPKWVTLTGGELRTLSPRLWVQTKGKMPSLAIELSDDNYTMYIMLPRHQIKTERSEVMYSGRRYVNDAWDDKLNKFKKWKEGKMELPKPTKQAPVEVPETKQAEQVAPVEPAQVEVAIEPNPVQPQPEPVAEDKPAEKPKAELKKRTRQPAPKTLNYEELIASISQVPESLTAAEAKAALRSLRDLSIAIARAMANISTQTLDAYEADANRYQELKKMIK